ncbi:MAG: SDR family oxidoreductase, partial [Cyclobacteriaceae bacterium]
MSDQKTIALFGATGMLALPVVKSFLQSGFKVRALVRDVAKAEKLFQQKIELYRGSLNSTIDIENVIKGCDAVYCNLSVNPDSTISDFQPEREGLDNLLSVAKIMKVSQFGYISSLVQRYEGMNNFHWWVFKIKNQAIAKIKNSGVPYTIFYPSTFMENWSVGQYRNGDKLLLVGKSKFPMWYIAGEDYGRQVAEAFKKEECLNAEYDIQGPEALTQSQAASKFAKSSPKP